MRKKVYNTNKHKAMGKPTTVEAMRWENGKVVVECIKAQAVCVSGLIWYNANEGKLKQIQEFVQQVKWNWIHKCLIVDIDIPTGRGQKKKKYMAWQLWYKLEKPVTKRSDFLPFLDEYVDIGNEFLAYFENLANEYGFKLL